MLSTVFLSLFMLFINLANCLPTNIINVDGKDVDVKLLKCDDNTVEPVLNVNKKEASVTSNLNEADSEVTTMSRTTTTMQNKDKEVEKELKVHDDYTKYPGHGYYKYHNDEANWTQARDICVEEGAHLAVVNSQAEADLLTGIIKTNKNTYIYLGFNRTSTYSEFVTVLGGRVSDSGYNKWYSASYPRTDSDSDCGYMYADGTLYNKQCIYSHNFICEI